MAEELKKPKAPLSVGLLAHVWAGRGVPHFYSPEKLGFLRAFRRLWYILAYRHSLR